MKKTVFLILTLSGLCFSLHTLALDDAALLQKVRSVIGKIPNAMPGAEGDSAALVELGEKLYFETALSLNYTQSCNSCHNILQGGHGVDHKKTSVGALGGAGRRNAPSTWNAGFQWLQNWDASAKTLAEQAESPILDPNEMALPSMQEAVKRLQAEYDELFKLAFPSSSRPLTFENITKALAAFQRTLITQDRFDAFLQGDIKALNEQEKRGFLQFQKNGCMSCHSGPMLGGQFVMKLGVVVPYPNTEDKGYAEVTGREDHNYLFKVPILRNVANTAPYFHDGAGATLEEAVFLTGWHQLGKKLSDSEVQDISAFLTSLNNIKPYTPIK